MANDMLGDLNGAQIDRDEGGSRLGGVIEGCLIAGAARAIAPPVVTFALGGGVRLLARPAS